MGVMKHLAMTLPRKELEAMLIAEIAEGHRLIARERAARRKRWAKLRRAIR